MEIHGKISEQDYMRAQWLHVKPRRAYRIAGYVVLALFVVTSIPIIIGSISLKEPRMAVSFFAPAVGLLFLAGLQWYLHRRVYRGQPSLHGKLYYQFSPTGFRVESQYGAGETSWDVFTKWREDSKLFVLYQGEGMFLMVPKRWFGDDAAAISEFRSLVQARAVESVDGL